MNILFLMKEIAIKQKWGEGQSRQISVRECQNLDHRSIVRIGLLEGVELVSKLNI